MVSDQASSTRQPVVVGFDDSAGAATAVDWAADEAAARGCPLLIVHAFQWTPPVLTAGWTGMDWGGEEQGRKLANNRLLTLAEQCRAVRPELEVHTSLPDGRPEQTLPMIAEEQRSPLLVLGSSGLSALPRALLGSTAGETVRTSRVPVVVVRGHTGETAGQGPVVVGADGSPASDRAVDFAFDFAGRHRLSVRVVHAWSDNPLDLMEPAHTGERQDNPAEADEPARRQVAARQRDCPDVPVHWERVDDRPAHALLTYAEDATLVVVGSNGRGPVSRVFLGSVSHAVLYHAPCPVAVLRAN
ncbi:Nucleotide-binding universal stress protein, UspA family [Amycolatopsis marina]|uniref:Nucleotide-binding universal stress protein, UspA family n=1 Tax=Amycolatopsis marina TaxID=490629 RepID=A0A1I1CEF0_9PSEU|nr:universal stress protein [Amycolatopsis marina]SFB60797.1 Nucleotide-binding universal stress protein, UspA family [Amycolatopsis marina]